MQVRARVISAGTFAVADSARGTVGGTTVALRAVDLSAPAPAEVFTVGKAAVGTIAPAAARLTSE